MAPACLNSAARRSQILAWRLLAQHVADRPCWGHIHSTQAPSVTFRLASQPVHSFESKQREGGGMRDDVQTPPVPSNFATFQLTTNETFWSSPLWHLAQELLEGQLASVR